jgi:hypothetical protein
MKIKQWYENHEGQIIWISITVFLVCLAWTFFSVTVTYTAGDCGKTPVYNGFRGVEHGCWEYGDGSFYHIICNGTQTYMGCAPP